MDEAIGGGRVWEMGIYILQAQSIRVKHIAHFVLSIPFESHSRNKKVVCFEESNASQIKA
jgi:hypothetical protein